MMEKLKSLVEDTLLLKEMRGIREELAGLRKGLETLVTLLVAQQPPPIVQSAPGDTEVTYVNVPYQAEVMDIEMRLTQAKGIPPTEEEILEEYERRIAGREDSAVDPRIPSSGVPPR